MHFIFPGRMALVDLPYEMVRVARLLDRLAFDTAFGVRLRLEPLAGDARVTYEDSVGERVEVLEVPPLSLSLGGGDPPADLFELQQFRVVSRLETRLKTPFRALTGPDRGPASLDRVITRSV
jgi:hypothetical protein